MKSNNPDGKSWNNNIYHHINCIRYRYTLTHSHTVADYTQCLRVFRISYENVVTLF